MTSSSNLQDPFIVVAEALRCSRDSLSIDSEMYRDHGWDSFGHISVVTAIEAACGMSITNDEIMEYTTMKAIVELFEKRREMGQREG